LRSSSSGWEQLNKSILIASEKFNIVGGLSICVDMSYIYDLENSEEKPTYCIFRNIPNYFLSPSLDENIMWLSSKEIAELAVEFNLSTNFQIDNMKNLFHRKNDPLSIVQNPLDITTSNKKPFNILKNFKIL
jgi:hypothetical protein